MLAWFPFGLHFSGFRSLVSDRRLWLSFAVHLLRHRCAFTTLSLRLCRRFLGLAAFDASSLSARQFCCLRSSVSFAVSLLRVCRALLCVIGARRTSVFDGLFRISCPHLVLQEWGAAQTFKRPSFIASSMCFSGEATVSSSIWFASSWNFVSVSNFLDSLFGVVFVWGIFQLSVRSYYFPEGSHVSFAAFLRLGSAVSILNLIPLSSNLLLRLRLLIDMR
jgi:hypothetical protein